MTILARCSHCDEPFERLFKFCPNCGLSVIGEGFTDKAGVAVRDLFEIARSFASISDLDVLLKKISKESEKLTQSEASSVMLLDENKEFLYFKTAGGEKGAIMKTIKVPMGQGIAGWVAQHGESLLIEDVAKDPRFSSTVSDDKSGFITRSILCVPLILGNEIIGVMEVLNKKQGVGGGKFSSDDLDILSSLAGFAAVSIANSKLNSEQKNFFANIMEILTAALETCSRNPIGHSYRTAQMACSLARRLKIDQSTYKTLYYASLLHDIGYIAIQKEAQIKKITPSPEKIEQLHPSVGADTVTPIQILRTCAPIIQTHHEYWDGSGFPNHLAGENIPLPARILGLVEALEDRRAPQMSEEEFLKQSEQFATENSGKLFDPQVVAAFLLEVASLRETE